VDGETFLVYDTPHTHVLYGQYGFLVKPCDPLVKLISTFISFSYFDTLCRVTDRDRLYQMKCKYAELAVDGAIQGVHDTFIMIVYT
jgi:hypothetical protein